MGWTLGEEREIVDLGLLTQTKISKTLSLRLVVVLVEVEIGGCGFNLGSDQWGVAMGKDVGRLGLGGQWPPLLFIYLFIN